MQRTNSRTVAKVWASGGQAQNHGEENIMNPEYLPISRIEFEKFAITILNDDNGVCELTYNWIHKYLCMLKSDDVQNNVEATDGRFYISEEFAKAKMKELNKKKEKFK